MQLTIHYAAGEDGGFVDVREGAVDGDVIGTAALPPTASWTDFQNVTIPLDAEATGGRLYFTFREMNSANPTDLFDLDEFTFIGKGVASNSAPTASATADKVAGPAPLAVNFTGTGADADGDPLTLRVGLHERRHARRDDREREPHLRGAGPVHRHVHRQRRRALAQRRDRHRGVPAAGLLPGQRPVRRDDARHRRAGAWCAVTTSSSRSRAAR